MPALPLLLRAPRRPLAWMIGAGFVVFLAYSMTRHLLFHSTAFDLGYFDQATYLISQGQPPIVSFWGYHFLGGHADWIMYPIAGLYRIYPSVYWLLVIQAGALALGALPIWLLAHQAGLKPPAAITMSAVYLLQPLVFNVNLFDFHPEVMALPLLLSAVWAARARKIGIFCLTIVLILGCRDALSLTVAAMGIWLIGFEQRRRYGVIALGVGIAWFLIATQVLIPHFRPGGVEAVGRYAELGSSIPEILQNLVLNPLLILGRLFNGDNFFYLFLLLSPMIWGLSLRHLAPLVGAIPTLAMNLLTDYYPQKDIVHQYSVPALPFLMLALIATVAAGQGWCRNRRAMILWALLAFLCLGKYSYVVTRYFSTIDTWQATRAAISQIHTPGGVLTTAQIAPHITHRAVVKLATTRTPNIDIGEFDYVLLNARYPGWEGNRQLVLKLINQLQTDPRFQIKLQQDEVFLFVRK
jgi:uncharacterized membrane protein